MSILAASLITVGVVAFVLFVRSKDLPPPPPVSPFEHLDGKKETVYDNLRDLQFEYRLGKLSDQDYQQTKADLQKELAKITEEIERLKASLHSAVPASAPPPPAPRPGFVCGQCGAEFRQTMKFCGECGQPMAGAQG